jgi:hypothetical protein
MDAKLSEPVDSVFGSSVSGSDEARGVGLARLVWKPDVVAGVETAAPETSKLGLLTRWRI